MRADHIRRAPWPYGEMDLKQLRESGWRPVPVRDVIVKVHARCNLACTYCYVYEHADQSWRGRPSVMPAEVWQATVASLTRHVVRHGLRSIRVILHGGEPLLLGAARIGELAGDLRASLEEHCAVEVGMQTNGVLLDERTMAQLRRHRVRVGVSVDGTRADHDRHRVTHDGRGTFHRVAAALDLLRQPENRASYGGLLCTVAAGTDPVATYEALRAFEPPSINFLLPHANWENPPERPPGSPTPHGDWLVAAFDRWYKDAKPPSVQLFEDVIVLLLGGRGSSEQIGLSPAALAVIETDGTIEQVDALKSAYQGASATGLDIRRDELDALLDDPGVVARQIGRVALSDDCLACPLHQVCGGGHYVHRYRAGAGFRNPSIYCADLQRLINHVRDRVVADFSALAGKVRA
ncbi:FxsB family cyclophane-forming radical SAM/SPASM peptide maturase [Phytohabitans sp. LJ34]|uniref:FxsB family cyclophane-forming radical SAM/SPASM peptide maturase n=1 Tax=Phytohabitans sp. LJ34 TaxID=3452217 RepID=UPI003F8A55BA